MLTHPFLKRFTHVFRVCLELFQSLEESAAKWDYKHSLNFVANFVFFRFVVSITSRSFPSSILQTNKERTRQNEDQTRTNEDRLDEDASERYRTSSAQTKEGTAKYNRVVKSY